MKITKKGWILGCSLAAALGLVGATGAGRLAYLILTGRLFGYEPPETPAVLREPRVVLGQGLFAKGEFFKAGPHQPFGRSPKRIRAIDDIAVGELDGATGVDVVLAHRDGAIIFDPGGAERGRVSFEKEEGGFGPFRVPYELSMLGNIQIIDVEGDGRCEYLGRGSLNGAALFAHDGRRLWGYGKYTEGKGSIDDLAPGDPDGDGTLEFIAGWEGMELLDHRGKKVWSQPTKPVYYQAEVVDVDGDGRREIINSHGDLTVRDARGEVLREVDLPFYLSSFSLCWRPGAKGPHLMAMKDGYVWLTDFGGKVEAKFTAPLSYLLDGGSKGPMGESLGTKVYRSEAAWVKSAGKGPERLAVVASFGALDRSLLYVFAADGQLLYQEVLPGECKAIAALLEANGEGQSWLVGGEGVVWRYQPR